MALTTAANIVGAINGNNTVLLNKSTPSNTPTAGWSLSYWQPGPVGGNPPAATNGAIPTSTTLGAIPFVYPSSGGLYIARIVLGTNLKGVNHCITWVDRLFHCDNMSGTVTTAQTLTTPPALTRYTSGVGVEMLLECYVSLGATPTTATVSYKNQSGTTQTSQTVTIPATVVGSSALFVPLAAGDTGVTAVNSVTLAGSTGTVGNFGVTLVKRLTTIPVLNSGSASQLAKHGITDYLQTGLPQVLQNACIVGYTLITSPTDAGFTGFMELVNQ